jgi:hypothetical protein
MKGEKLTQVGNDADEAFRGDVAFLEVVLGCRRDGAVEGEFEVAIERRWSVFAIWEDQKRSRSRGSREKKRLETHLTMALRGVRTMRVEWLARRGAERGIREREERTFM